LLLLLRPPTLLLLLRPLLRCWAAERQQGRREPLLRRGSPALAGARSRAPSGAGRAGAQAARAA
jgi:hypothetical protein